MPGSDKKFLKAVSISATVHFAAAALVLFSLAPIPSALLSSEEQDIITVSLVGLSIGSQKTKDLGSSRSVAREDGSSGRPRQTTEESIANEEEKVDLTEKKNQLAGVALAFYANERPAHPDKIRGTPEKTAGRNSGAVNHAASGNGAAEGLRTPLLIPAYRQNNPPRYPAAARLRGHEGLVLVAAEILANGSVGNVKIKKSSGHKDLDDSALEAVRKWLFQPGRQMGVAISMWVDVPVRFALRE